MSKSSGQARWGSSISLSVLLHLLLAAGLFGAWWWTRAPKPVEQRLGIEATVINGTAPANTARAPAPDPTPPQAEEPPPEPQPEPPPPDNSAELERQKAEAEAARVAEERRVAAQREAAEREARQETERQAQEKAAQEKAAREKAEREKAEKEKVERDKAEKERLAREKAEREKQEKDRQLKAEAERARIARETELNAQLAAEERIAAARASGKMAEYVGMITRAIESRWIRPPNAKPGLDCEVRVTQVPGGVVTAAQVVRCNGDESVRQSIEAAVLRASPLPQPSDPALFERNLVVTFRPDR